MTGILGGAATGASLRAMSEAIQYESWYETDLFEDGECGLGLVHHGEKDSLGRATWEGPNRAGVIHGALVERTHKTNTERLVQNVLDAPRETLREVDGSFAIACVDFDQDRFVLATDKLGSRPCYYTADDNPVFGSSVAALRSTLNDPTVNKQAISDLLLMGNMWGEKTLIEGVRALAPASILEHTDGETTIERYWKPDFESSSTDGYIRDLIDIYQRAIQDAATTLEGNVGVWLSGGLDSRTLAGVLAKNRTDDGSLTAYTYDANPRGGGNPALAAEVASHLDMGFQEIEHTPDQFLSVMDDAIDRTDGMVRWTTFLPLSATYGLPDDTDVMLEAAGQGGLMGHHLRRYHLTHTDSAVESMYQSEAVEDQDTVRELMSVSVDPLESFRMAAARSNETQPKKVVLDAHFDNHYSRGEYATDRLAQTRTGVRVPFAHGALLEHAAQLPTSYRMGTFPCTRGQIPYGVTKPKLALTRAAGEELASIRYERTGVAPKRPYPIHIAGFVATTSLNRLRSATTYGGQRLADVWYREHDGLRNRLDELLADACGRPFFNGTEIRRLQHEHLTGTAHHMTGILSSITTIESWLQRHLG